MKNKSVTNLLPFMFITNTLSFQKGPGDDKRVPTRSYTNV